MAPKNRTLDGKNWTLGGGRGCQKSSKIVGTTFVDVPLLENSVAAKKSNFYF